MAQPTTATEDAEVHAFLTRHPEILVGREAQEKAEDEAGGDTFSIINKPFKNVVLYQIFNADTLERESAAVLINDQMSLDYYSKQNRDEDDSEPDTVSCPGCGAGSSRADVKGPERFLIERMVKYTAFHWGQRISLMGGEDFTRAVGTHDRVIPCLFNGVPY
ncbi:hypothetical protein NLG97_g4114 [Lecanicillium saksenae]|uniref:Uncharacterized protein n=1 Tax=Lecanicillium saksenae TaxID=468837 RepID=A0ACC1QY32_9HYPO|nr:hypothetical protein NLG97_g4114 [Lecanicillium saksenae]